MIAIAIQCIGCGHIEPEPASTWPRVDVSAGVGVCGTCERWIGVWDGGRSDRVRTETVALPLHERRDRHYDL